MLSYVSPINTEQFARELAMYPDREKSQLRGSTGTHILERDAHTPLPRIARVQTRYRMVERVVDELKRQKFL